MRMPLNERCQATQQSLFAKNPSRPFVVLFIAHYFSHFCDFLRKQAHFSKSEIFREKMSVDIQHILSNMQAGLQDQAAKVKEATKHRDNFAQNIAKLEAQLNETKVVMDELGKSINESLLISCFFQKK